ncbi:hypothetical protein [Polymorphospora lycopeni]|uniref:Flp pilus-assembly TadG-like N-terminal domain-containing protein n=1 Tax=Polymorphospora lycopeni TaxID=3140240 RepID=A0ABV5CIV9_9ACTN
MSGMRADSGRVSVFVAVAIGAVLLIVGLVVDGVGRLRTQQLADNIAAEAARTGGQQIDRAAAVGGGAKVVDVDEAVAAAEAYVDGFVLPDNITATGTAEPVAGDGTRLRVIVTLTYQPVMLTFLGADVGTVTGQATAVLLTEEP